MAMMIISALAFVLVPLWRTQETAATHAERDVNLAVYKDRLEGIEDMAMAECLPAITIAAARLETTRILVTDAASDEPPPIINNSRYLFTFTILILILLPLISINLYSHWGASRQLQAWMTSQNSDPTLIAAEQHYLNHPDELVQRMQTVLAQHPDSTRGWMLLGRLYLAQQQWSPARSAFDHAMQLQPHNTEAILSFAEASFMQGQGKLEDHARTLCQTVLAKEPTQPLALSLLAMSAYHQQHYAEAIHYWEQLAAELPPQGDDNKTIMKLIADAHRRVAG